MTWSQFLFSFEGRIGRAWYWFYALAITVFFCGLFLLWGMASFSGNMAEGGGPGAGAAIMGVVIMLVSLASLWPTLAVLAKRWHDVDKSAWWILIALIPAVGGLIALIFNGFLPGTPGPNKYGDPPA